MHNEDQIQECKHLIQNYFADNFENLNVQNVINMLNKLGANVIESLLEQKFLKQCQSDHDHDCSTTLIHYLVLINDDDDRILRAILENFPVKNIDQRNSIHQPCSIDNDHMIANVTPLWTAALYGHFKQLKLLLEYGADPNATNDNDATAIRLLCDNDCSQEENIAMIKLLLQYNADINKPNKFRNTPLMLAANSNNEKIVKYLLENGADPNIAAYCGGTALHFAVKNYNFEIVKMLMAHGAMLQEDNNGLTPLFLAAYENFVDLFRQMLHIWTCDLKQQFTIEDRITAYELLAIGCLLNDNPFTTIRKYLRIAFQLRYLPADYDGEFNENQLFAVDDPKQLPIRRKINNFKHYININDNLFDETQTLNEFDQINDDEQQLFYECLYVVERFFSKESVKKVNNLNVFGKLFIEKFQNYTNALDLFENAIRIKINLRVFVSNDFNDYFEHLDPRKFDEIQFRYNQKLLQLIIDYLQSFSLPNGALQAMPFQLNAYELCEHIEHFTLNDVKIERLFPNGFSNNDKIFGDSTTGNISELSDMNQVLNVAYYLLKYFARFYGNFNDKQRQIIEKLVKNFLELNYTNIDYGRHMIHSIFAYDNWSNKLSILKALIKLLLKCGANTNVYDNMYNTPLHYLANYGHKNHVSIREIQPIFNELCEHVYYGKYVQNALYHFDYADLQSIHLDAKNIYNQTLFDIYPNLKYCSPKSMVKHLNLFPLKCLAARKVHQIYLTCDQCKNVYKNTDEHNNNNKYIDHHRILPYSAKRIWQIINDYGRKLRLSPKLLEFIELHGPCKFVQIAFDMGC